MGYNQFMKARFKHRKIEERVVVAEFECEGGFVFHPGQYIQIVLANGDKRYFSITNSPNEKSIIRIATRPGDSAFKKDLLGMKEGTEVAINGPWGDLDLPKDKARPLIFIAGGIGITPFLSMVTFAEEEKWPTEIDFLRFDSDEPIFREEIQALADRYKNLKVHYFSIRADTDALRPFFKPDAKQMFLLAGPTGFVNSVFEILRGIGVEPRNIAFESFTGY